ncbi:MAG: type II toxin-antitoxin system VapC family toxin [Candidatus Binatia bacterium]
MTPYAETSAVLRWLFNESGGDEILELLRSSTKVVCSRLTLIETYRSLRRAVALGELAETTAAEVRAVLAQASARWALLEISSAVGERAEQAFPVEPVRTLDAIHLASALLLRQSIPDLSVLSTDTRVRDNASQLGFDVFPTSAEPEPSAPGSR